MDLVRIEPTNLVSSSGASDGRLGIYAPKQRQELVINRAETVTRVSTNTQTTRYFFFKTGEDQKIETRAPVVRELEPSVVTGLSGTYLFTATTDLTAPYRVTAQQVSSTRVRGTNTVNDKRILGVGDVVTTWTVTRTSTELYSHRLKADYGVLINFDGTDSGGLNVVSTGDIMLSGPVRNTFGSTNLSSEAGSLLTADVSVVVNVGNTSLAALGGRIDGNGSEFRIEQTAGSTLSAIARDSINLREMNGDLRISSVVTTGRGGAATNSLVGQVRVTADGGIIGVGDGPHVVGSSLDLTAITGGIGATGAPLIITEDGGALTARANGDINLRESTGDLNLRDVQSQTGDVTVAVPLGSILDRNDIETRDSRNDAELAELWSNDLGLFGDAQVIPREAAQIAALKAERERSYNDYWNAREASGGAPLTFVLDATTAQDLRNGGWTDAQIAAYVAEREGLFAQWNADDTRDSDYTYTVTLEERAAVLDGAIWSAQQLQEWIRAGLIRGTGDTNARIEDPNIRAAGDMTIITRDNVGELLPDFILGTDRAENLRVLSAAERADITIDTVTNTVSVARRENLNIAFTATDAEGRPLGSLDVPLVGGDIFIGSEAAVDIKQIAATGDVFLQFDGAVTDDSPADTAAITGLNLVLESGNTAPMGMLAAPLSLDIRDGGSLIARSGVGLYLETIGDAPLAELFSGGVLVLNAAGQITDAVATGAVRVRAEDITLEATSIGTETTPLVIELTGAEGAADLMTRTGDAFVAAQGALRLRTADLFGGGVLSTTQGLVLVGHDTLGFGTAATLQLIAPDGIDLTTSTGRDIAGGALTIQSGGAVGTQDKPLTTALTSLDFSATGTGATPLFIDEADDLVVDVITQTATGSETEIVAAGVLSVVVITSAAEVRLDAGAIPTGTITATRTQLVAGMGLGTTTRLDITTGALQALSTAGDIRITLRDRDVDIEDMQTGDTGSIDLISTDAVVTLLDGNGISTAGGAITGQLTQLVAGADITSSGGDIALTTEQALTQLANTKIDSAGGMVAVTATGDLTQTASAEITSGTGTLSVGVGGNMQIARIATTNATADALALDVAGELTVAAGQEPVQIEANTSGALSVLRIGRLVPKGPEGLRVAMDTLDMETRLGDIHINEGDGIVLQNVVALRGLIDIFSAGRTEIQTIRAETAAPIVLTTSSGDMLADNAVIAGGDTRIFALGGALAGITSDTFRANTSEGTTLHLFASSNLRYTETAGDLRVGFALADQGDLTLEALDGSQRIGLLGATSALSLRARDSLRVTMIGETSVDLADAEALSLVNPVVYGLREAKSPRDVDLLTQAAGGEIVVGLIGVQTSLDLVGDRIDLLTYDVDPARGLVMTVMDATGGLADRVDLASVGAGAKLFVVDGDYFTDPRPRLLDRGRTSGATGTLTLTQGYIGTGDLSHAGPSFIGDDIRIGGDVWFRQGNFDLLATTQYVTLSTVADAQALAFFGNEMTFEIRENILLDTIARDQPIDGSGGTVLVLNRRLGGMDLNGGQGFAFGTGVDTDILGFLTGFQDADQGVTMPLVIKDMMEQYDMGTTLSLNGFVTQPDCAEDGSCPDLSAVR